MKEEFIKISKSKKFFDGQFRMMHFKDGDSHILYLPSLGISGYGDTPEEAHEILKISITEFTNELIKLPEHKMFEELRKFGWKRDKIFRKKMKNLSNTTFDDIKKQFNIPDTVEISESSLTV